MNVINRSHWTQRKQRPGSIAAELMAGSAIVQVGLQAESRNWFLWSLWRSPQVAQMITSPPRTGKLSNAIIINKMSFIISIVWFVLDLNISLCCLSVSNEPARFLLDHISRRRMIESISSWCWWDWSSPLQHYWSRWSTRTSKLVRVNRPSQLLRWCTTSPHITASSPLRSVGKTRRWLKMFIRSSQPGLR